MCAERLGMYIDEAFSDASASGGGEDMKACVERLLDAMIDKELSTPLHKSECCRTNPPDPCNSYLVPAPPTTLQILQDISNSSPSPSSSDTNFPLSMKELLEHYMCSDLKFPNPLGDEQDLSKTLREKNTSWRPVINQISIFTMSFIAFSQAFLDSDYCRGNELSSEDQVRVMQGRMHAAITPMLTAVFSAQTQSMTLLIDGQQYTMQAGRCFNGLVASLPAPCHKASRGDRYRTLLSQISCQDFAVIGLFVLLKLLDLSDPRRPAEVEHKCRRLFVRVAQSLRRHCLHKFGPRVGLHKFQSLVSLFNWSLAYDASVQAVLAIVAV